MDTRRVTPRLCLTLTAALTLLGVVVRSVCFLCCFDVDPGYFTAGILPALSRILYFAAVLLPVVLVLLTSPSAYPGDLVQPHRTIPAVGLGVALVIFTAVSALLRFPTRTGDIMIIPTFLGVIASVYYFLSHKRNGTYPDSLAFLGYLPVLWCIAAVGELYFDPYVTMNSPVKISLQLGLLGFMLIGLAELRYRIGRPLPRYAAGFWAIGAYMCLTGAIPVLIATGAGILDNLSHLLCAVVLLPAGVYGFCLLFSHTALSVSPADPQAPDTPA